MIIKQGWGHYRQSRFLPWRLRWFVLRHDAEGIFDVYNKRGDAADWRLADESIHLTSCVIEVKAAKSKEKRNVFVLKTLSKMVHTDITHLTTKHTLITV
jgi:hypothetical protein